MSMSIYNSQNPEEISNSLQQEKKNKSRLPDPETLKYLNKVLDSKDIFHELIDVNKPIQESLKKKSEGGLGNITDKLEKVAELDRKHKARKNKVEDMDFSSNLEQFLEASSSDEETDEIVCQNMIKKWIQDLD